MGPLLFSLTIHQMALELKGHPGLDGTLWYLDDGSLRGSPKAVFEAYQVLCTRSSELGLEVNANKCELISTGGVSKEDLEAVGFTLNEGGQDAMGEGGFRLLDVGRGSTSWASPLGLWLSARSTWPRRWTIPAATWKPLWTSGTPRQPSTY